MRGDQAHTERLRMLAQRGFGGRAELEVVGRDGDALPAQVLGEDAPDLAVADEPDLPVARVHRLQSSETLARLTTSAYFFDSAPTKAPNCSRVAGKVS